MRALSKQGRRLIPPYDAARRLPCELEAAALMPEADGSWQVPSLLHLYEDSSSPLTCKPNVPVHHRLPHLHRLGACPQRGMAACERCDARSSDATPHARPLAPWPCPAVLEPNSRCGPRRQCARSSSSTRCRPWGGCVIQLKVPPVLFSRSRASIPSTFLCTKEAIPHFAARCSRRRRAQGGCRQRGCYRCSSSMAFHGGGSGTLSWAYP